MGRRTRQVVLLGLVAAGLALLAAVALRRDDARPEGDPADGAGPAATRAPRPADGGALAGGRTSERAAEPEADDARAPGARADGAAATPAPGAADAPRRVRVRGRVTGLGAVPPDAWVWVVTRTPTPTYVARAPVAADGSFTAEGVVSGVEPPWPLRVSAQVPGAVVEPVEVEGRADETVEVTLPVASDEGVFHVRVVDAAQRPVAGLGVLLVRTGANPFVHAEYPRREVGRAAGDRDDEFAARATTDADGRFTLRGLVETAYSFAAADETTWLEVPHGTWVVPREDEIVLVARSAYVVRVVATLPEGTPVGGWNGAAFTLTPRPGGGSMLVGTTDGRTLFRGALPDDGDGTLELHLAVVAPGFEPEERALRVGRASPSVDVAVTLRALDPAAFGALVLRSSLVGTGGRPLAPRVLEWRTSGRSRSGFWVREEPRGDGRVAFRLSEGSHALEVQAPQGTPFEDLLAWRGDVRIARGEDLERAFPAVPTGSMRVRLPPDDGSGWVSASVRRDGATSVWTGTCTSREWVVPALPVGPWRLSLAVRRPGGRSGSSEHTASVSVVEGSETLVELAETR